jgi:uncharacterized membrane protein YkoI
MFEGDDDDVAAKANQMTKMKRAKFNFYRKTKRTYKEMKKKLLKKQAAEAEAARLERERIGD